MIREGTLLLNIRRILSWFGTITGICQQKNISSLAKMSNIRSGTNFYSLPLEIRNEIYRYLVKRRYSFKYYNKVEIELGAENPDFAIFSVSKAAYDEATSVFYSESVFNFYADLTCASIDYPVGAVLERMMNIELELWCYLWFGYDYDAHEYGAAQLESKVRKLKGRDTLRDTLQVKFIETEPYEPKKLGWCESVLACYLKELVDLVGFRTVVIEVEFADDTSEEKLNAAEWRHLSEAIEEIFVSTMGPATVSRVDPDIYLEFHPLEYQRVSLGVKR